MIMAQTNAAYELAVRRCDSSSVSGHRDMQACRNGLGARVKLGLTALQAESIELGGSRCGADSLVGFCSASLLP